MNIESVYNTHVKTVYRVCFTYMKTHADTEDAVSETFIRLMRASPTLHSTEHEKAWLIRTAACVCKDLLKHSRRKHANLDDYADTLYAQNDAVSLLEADEVARAVSELPDKYKAVVYLHYYEGYSSVQIARSLKKPDSTIRYFLSKARKILKERLGEDYEQR
jgi:RNA polymerase sigma-70 factor (ECF subfamily)